MYTQGWHLITLPRFIGRKKVLDFIHTQVLGTCQAGEHQQEQITGSVTDGLCKISIAESLQDKKYIGQWRYLTHKCIQLVHLRLTSYMLGTSGYGRWKEKHSFAILFESVLCCSLPCPALWDYVSRDCLPKGFQTDLANGRQWEDWKVRRQENPEYFYPPFSSLGGFST